MQWVPVIDPERPKFEHMVGRENSKQLVHSRQFRSDDVKLNAHADGKQFERLPSLVYFCRLFKFYDFRAKASRRCSSIASQKFAQVRRSAIHLIACKA